MPLLLMPGKLSNPDISVKLIIPPLHSLWRWVCVTQALRSSLCSPLLCILANKPDDVVHSEVSEID